MRSFDRQIFITRSEPSRILCVLVLAACVLGILAGRTRAGEPDRELSVTFSALGPAGEGAEGAGGFVRSLDAREGISAKMAPGPARGWSGPPAGVDRREWVSLVAVGFQDRIDWLALQFAGPGDSVSLAVRRPARTAYPDVPRRDRIAPGPNQISSNAVKELAADLGHALDQPLRGERVRLRIHATEWEREGFGGGGAGPALPGAAAAGAVEKADMEGMTALALAAAFSAGWQPITAEADTVLEVGVAREVRAYSLRASMSQEGRNFTRRLESVPADQIYPHLVRLMTMLRQPDSVRDIFRPGAGAVPMLFSGGKLLVAAGGGLSALDPPTGEELWRIERPRRGSHRFAVREGGLYRVNSGLHRVEADGGQQTLADLSPPHPWSFALISRGSVVCGNRAVACFEEGRKAWQWQADAELTAGPAVRDGRVSVGSASGEVTTLDLEDGAPVWSRRAGVPFQGPMGTTAELVLAGSRAGSLLALSRGDGKQRWSAEIGDVLLERPVAAGGGVLVASRANRIMLLDPKDGHIISWHRFDTWLLAARVIREGGEALAACVDLRGNVTFLSLPALESVRTVSLGRKLRPRVVFAGAMPSRWGAGREASFEEEPTVLVADRRGFVYLLSLPGSRSQEDTR